MSQIYYFPKESTTSSLRVCRGCLATDVRLYDMRQNRLMEAYSTLLTTAIQVTDDLPHYLCSYCATLVLKCNTFRIKCTDAQAVLRNVQLEKSELTLENIKQLDRPPHYKQTYIQTININEANNSNLPDSTYISEYCIEDIKTEVDFESDRQENEGEDNFKFISNLGDDDNIVNILENKAPNNQANLKIEQVELECKTNIKASDKKVVSAESDDSDFEVSSCVSSSSDTDFEVDTTSKPKRSSAKGKKVNKKTEFPKTRKGRNAKETNSTKVRTKLPANFGELYNVELVHLDKDEQLKEIEDRKGSDNYLQGHFKCNVCFKGFVVEESYNNHMLLHDDISGTEVCDVCHCHFMNKKQLSKHRDHHRRRFTCRECGHATQYIAKAKQHSRWHKGLKFKCKHCGKEFKGLTSHFTHLKMLHPTSDQLVRCEICGDSFTGPTGLRSHENRAHKEMRSSECYCSGCETQFYSSDAFKTHQGSDGACDPRAKCCVRCGMAFETQQLLEEHEIEQRKPRDVFECEVCHKRYSNYISYKTHRRRHSPIPRPKRDANRPKRAAPKDQGPKAKRPKGNPEDKAIVRISTICEICGKVLKNRSFLKLHHVMSHTDLKPHKCNECPKKFRSSMNLKVHMRTHTGERPYQCEHCPKAFQNIGNLKRHNLVHTGERPHTCELCGKSFQTKDCVQTHVKTVHMKIPMPPRIRRRNKKTE